jgi:hypothetical protein
MICGSTSAPTSLSVPPLTLSPTPFVRMLKILLLLFDLLGFFIQPTSMPTSTPCDPVVDCQQCLNTKYGYTNGLFGLSFLSCRYCANGRCAADCGASAAASCPTRKCEERRAFVHPCLARLNTFDAAPPVGTVVGSCGSITNCASCVIARDPNCKTASDAVVAAELNTTSLKKTQSAVTSVRCSIRAAGRRNASAL